MNAPRPTLPNPGVTFGGHVACNVPLAGAGFCERLVKRDGKLSRHAWVDSEGRTVNHKGPHRIEWR